MAKQYVEKPYKVQADQWDPAQTDPLQAGVCLCVPRPHVHGVDGIAVMLTAGDWIYTDLFHDNYQVMPDAEFAAKFGGGALAEEG